MGFFKKDRKVFGMTFMVRMLVAFFAVILLGVSGTGLMADWGLVGTSNGTEDDVYTLGNVGIGTDNVPYKFYVVTDNIDDTAAVFRNSNLDGLSIFTTDYSTGIAPYKVSTQKGMLSYIYATNTWQFRTYNSDRLTINGNGKIGIGTTEPETHLEVQNGTLRISGSSHWDEDTARFVIDTGASYAHDPIECRNSNGIIFKVRSNNDGSGGRVGINTGSPSSTLDIAGTTTSTLYKCSSDARYKKNVNPYGNALQKVLGLRGVTYFWKTAEYKEHNFSKDKQVGFIAQEVEKVIPELVYTDDKGYKTMSYDRLTAVLVEAVKELKVKNDKRDTENEAKIAALEAENAELKQKLAKLDSLEKRFADLEKSTEKYEARIARIAKK